MPFPGSSQWRTREYRSAYREEVKRQRDAALRDSVRSDVFEARKTRRERVADAYDPGVRGKQRLYKNVGGRLSVRDDALSRLKRIGR